jgi:hypothetical protein
MPLLLCVLFFGSFPFKWFEMLFEVSNVIYMYIYISVFKRVCYFLGLFPNACEDNPFSSVFISCFFCYYYCAFELPYSLLIMETNSCYAILILWFVFRYIYFLVIFDMCPSYSINNLNLTCMFCWVAWVIMDIKFCVCGFSVNVKIKIVLSVWNF